MRNDRLHPLFRAAFDDLRDGNAALARAAAKGPLKQDGTRMAYLRTRDDDDPEYRTSEEEMTAEIADQARVIADLDEALTKIAEIAGDYGDGAPDDHYLAHILLQLEAIDPVTIARLGGWKTPRHVFDTYGHAMEDRTLTEALLRKKNQ